MKKKTQFKSRSNFMFVERKHVADILHYHYRREMGILKKTAYGYSLNGSPLFVEIP